MNTTISLSKKGIKELKKSITGLEKELSNTIASLEKKDNNGNSIPEIREPVDE